MDLRGARGGDGRRWRGRGAARADGDAGCVSRVSAWVAGARGGMLAFGGARMGREGDAP